MPANAQGIRAGKAFVELFADDSKLRRGLNAAQKRLKAFGASVTALGAKMAAAGTAILTPLLGAAKVFAAVGDQLDKMRARTGFSAAALSELGFAAEQGGASIDQLDRSLAAMARFALMAERDMATATDVLDLLGVSVDRFKAASPEQRFLLLADAISKVKDPTLKAGIALQVFGRSGRELLPMLEGGAAGIEQLRDEARRLGITLTDEDATSAAQLTDALNRLRRQLKAIIVQIGAALAPALTEIQQRIAPIIKSVIDWVKQNKTLIITVAKIASVVIAVGTGLIVLGATISGFGAALGGISTVLGLVGKGIALVGTAVSALLSPMGLVIAAVVSLGGYLLYVSGVGAKALQWLSDRFSQLKQDALAAWQGIGDALAAGDIGLAAKILWLTLKMEWKRGVNFINGLWQQAKNFMVSTWSEAVFNTANVLNDGWAAVEVAWTETVAFLADAWSLFTNVLTKTWHTAIGFIKKSWVRLKALFDSDINVNAEVNRINRETGAATAAADQELLAAVGQRDQERQQRRADIEQRRGAIESDLASQQERERAARDKAQADSLKQTKDELADARRQWQEAIGEAAQKRAEVEAGEPDRVKKLQDELDLGGGALAEAQRNVEVKGTFSALAARGLGADNLASRTAKGVEEIAGHAEQLVDLAKQGQLVFAP